MTCSKSQLQVIRTPSITSTTNTTPSTKRTAAVTSSTKLTWPVEAIGQLEVRKSQAVSFSTVIDWYHTWGVQHIKQIGFSFDVLHYETHWHWLDANSSLSLKSVCISVTFLQKISLKTRNLTKKQKTAHSVICLRVSQDWLGYREFQQWAYRQKMIFHGEDGRQQRHFE